MVCHFCFSNSLYNKTNIFIGLMEYELNGLLSALHLVDYTSAHIRFDLERYLLNIAHLLYTDLHINGNRFLAILYYIICITFYYIIYRTLTILVFGLYFIFYL